jgi:hypothetical protein
MSGDMIERVAKAIEQGIADLDLRGPGPLDYASVARAAIEAMRELPTEPGPRYTAGEYSRRTQDAMVNDALSVTVGLPEAQKTL